METLVDRWRHRVKRAWRGSRVGATLWTALLVGAGLLLELLARRSSSDLEDLTSVLALVGLVLVAARGLPEHFPRGHRALCRARRRALAMLGRHRIQLGFDLRGSPPIPRRFPPQVLLPVAASVATCTLVGSTLGQWPGAAREALRDLSGLACVAALAGVWGATLALALALTFLPLHWLDAVLDNSPAWRPRRRTVRHAALALHVGLLAACAVLLPIEIALLVVAFTVVLEALDALLPGQRSLVMLWRRKQEAGEVCSISFGLVNLSIFAAAAAAIVSLALVGVGEELAGNASADTICSRVLGTALIWSAAGFCVAFVLPQMAYSLRVQLEDPALSLPPVAWVDGARASERAAIRSGLARAGLRARFAPRARRATDVPLALATAPLAADSTTPTWPLAIRPADLEDPSVQRTVHRRVEILSRRNLMKGLAKSFKAAARRRYRKGEGYWLAAHLWIQDRLARDTEENERWIVGPAYRRILTRQARRHFHAVMQALEIDLIFVADGVGFRRLKPVLGILFECYDVYGPRRLVDERFFRGVPGVRVLFQDFTLERPLLGTKRYTEPDYDELARARILHVFRDRGDDEHEDRVPTGSGRKPRTRDRSPVGGPA